MFFSQTFPARLATIIGFPMSLGWVWKKKKRPRQKSVCLKNAICIQNIQINSNSLGHSLMPIKIFGRRPPPTSSIYWQSAFPSKALSWSLRKDIKLLLHANYYRKNFICYPFLIFPQTYSKNGTFQPWSLTLSSFMHHLLRRQRIPGTNCARQTRD